MVPVPVDAGQLADLIEMGFSDVKARKGVLGFASSAHLIHISVFLYVYSISSCYRLTNGPN